MHSLEGCPAEINHKRTTVPLVVTALFWKIGQAVPFARAAMDIVARGDREERTSSDVRANSAAWSPGRRRLSCSSSVVLYSTWISFREARPCCDARFVVELYSSLRSK